MIEKELPEVDTLVGYENLQGDIRRNLRRRRALTAAAAAVVLAAGVGLGAGTLLAGDHDNSTPRPSHTPSTGDSTVCSAPHVHCLGNDSFRFALVRPVEWRIPPSFGAASGGGVLPLMVESYRHDGQAGVTVMERVRASTLDGSGPAPGVADSPRAFVRWVASRPFLSAGPVRTTTLDGHRAWQVQVSLVPHLPQGPALCSGRFACYSLTHQPDGSNTGIFGAQADEYTAFRLPGGGTTVVWSWVFHPNSDHLSTLEGIVHGLSWPNH